jgi:BirA family transcriptional regulator, biotin operon repressor / biotin---[acetyl-CoA-carboxylase] ligase
MLGSPRLHLRTVGSTNDRARDLAMAGAPHGALVTASSQSAGRGRQGRVWTTQPGTALAMSLLLRDPPPALPLIAAVAVAETIGDDAMIKWPNDVLVDGRKVSGILAEGRPHESWAILGIGVNIAVEISLLPPEVQDRAASLGLPRSAVEPFLSSLLTSLEHHLSAPLEETLTTWRTRDALLGRTITWSDGTGTASGIDPTGELLVTLDSGDTITLNAGEVHLGRLPAT